MYAVDTEIVAQMKNNTKKFIVNAETMSNNCTYDYVSGHKVIL